MSALSDLIGVILPGGLAVGLVVIVNAVKSWREGKQSQQETAIGRYQRMLREADHRTQVAEVDEDYALDLVEYWRKAYSELAFQARQTHGMSIPELPPIPEKKKLRASRNVQTRRRRASSRDLLEVEE